MKRIYTLLVAAMAAVCGAWADDVMITEVGFRLSIDEIEYRIGVKEETVQSNIKKKITGESSDKYYINKGNIFLILSTDMIYFWGVSNGEYPIGSRSDAVKYYFKVLFETKSDTIIFTPDASALTVTYNGAVVTPTKVEISNSRKLLWVTLPLGEPAAATVTLYTLTCVNARQKNQSSDTFTGGDYAEGASVTFRAKSPAVGEQFDHWEATGIELSDSEKTTELITITMPANAVTITAVYKKIDYKIIIADDIENGTVSVTSGAATANFDDEVALTVTPATGYELDEISAKNESGGTVTLSEDYKFTMPSSNVTVTATFKVQTATALATAQALDLRTENGRVIYDGEFQIFTLTGQNVTRLNGSLNGVYIVKVGDKAQKVIVSSK